MLNQDSLTREDIVLLLNLPRNEASALYEKAASVRRQYVGDKVHLRGLIELSNICEKNCYYCGIRKDNRQIRRYNIPDDEVLKAARFAFDNGFGSIALQSGEIQSDSFTRRISRLLRQIKKIGDGSLGITLSCGEQSREVYQEWFEAGAHRYLLRIETSGKGLYGRLHPDDTRHRWDSRVRCLHDLQETGYQTGTGVMIGLPFQTAEELADDLLFMKSFDIDMCGMGPYVVHNDTPLAVHESLLLPVEQRFELTMKMVAVLRIMMKDINIVSATAVQAIRKGGREKILQAGANVLMPNITPGKYRDSYLLYRNKPGTDESAEDAVKNIEALVKAAGMTIEYGKWGDSRHYLEKRKNTSHQH